MTVGSATATFAARLAVLPTAISNHARRLGLPVDQLSPVERRQRFEEDMRAAKERLRQR